jgi:branched-chain amino acid transport system substrate-binding protein
MSSKKGVTRRGFLTVAVSAIVAGVVAGVGGYYAGTLAAPAEVVREVTKTIERTTTITPSPTTVTRTVTTTVTASATATTTTTPTTTATPPAPDYIKIGWPAPLTGAEAPFTESYPWLVRKVEEVVNKQGGVYVAKYGKKIPIKIILRDTQSDTGMATTVTEDLITREGVHMIVSSVASSAVPVSTTVERYGIPAIISQAVVLAWLKGGPYKWAYIAFFAEPVCYLGYMAYWQKVLKKPPNEIIIGAIWNDDPAGRGFREAFTKVVGKRGYQIIDVGLVAWGTKDFSAYIERWKRERVEVLVANMIAPDFATLWRQTREMGFIPKLTSIGRAIMFPSNVEALGGDLPLGIATEYSFGPAYPTRSKLLNVTAREFCDLWEKESGRQWTEPIGPALHLLELALNAIERAGNLEPEAIRNAIADTDTDTILGHVNFKRPYPPEVQEIVPDFPQLGDYKEHISLTPQVVGQWFKGTKYKWDKKVVENGIWKEIPIEAEPKTIPELLGIS